MPMEKTRLKVLNKLMDNGYDTEKKITSMDTPMMLLVPTITVPEIQIILEMQDAIKGRRILSYLSGGKDDTKPRKKDTPEVQDDPEDEIADEAAETEVDDYDGFY